ncbi:insulinase family protein [bacterium]|nr:insulinase family protein [bacterium]
MKIEETIRDDGLRIITCRIPSKKVYVELTAGVGSAYDQPGQEGLFHYFEHMAFKGTARRPVDEIRSFSRRNILASNASTGKIETRYYGTAVARKFSELCDFLCDIFFHSEFPPEEIEREKEVVLNEIARDEDRDSTVAFCRLRESLWRRNPLRVFGVGTPPGVRSVGRDVLLATKEKWYIPSNTLAIAAGKIDHHDFVCELNKHIPYNFRAVRHYSWDDELEAPPVHREILVPRGLRNRATCVFGCKFPVFADDKRIAVSKILQHSLVTGSGSVLWRELREKRGLAYSLSGRVTASYRLGADFSVYVETLPDRIDNVRELLPQILFKPFTDKSIFEETKEFLLDWYALGHDDPDDYAALIRSQIYRGKTPKSTERYFNRFCKALSSVTIDEVESLREATLVPERFVTVIVKPV